MLTREEIRSALEARHTKEIQESAYNRQKWRWQDLGGLGSNVAFSLARIGVGHLHLLDFDRVDITNSEQAAIPDAPYRNV